MELFLAVLICGLAGGLAGSLSGIVPGLHVNTLALLMLGVAALLEGWLEPMTSTQGEVALLMAVLLASTGLAHTFVNFIPSTFLGAPEGETALSVLPAHRMLLEGQGYRAVLLSALGSLMAVGWVLALLLPLRWIVGSPVDLYLKIKHHLLWVLMGIAAILITTESRQVPYRRVRFKGQTIRVRGPLSRWLGRGLATGVFLLAGMLGLVTWDLETTSPLDLPSSVLFPVFTGLFGLATLLMSWGNLPDLPEQRMERVSVGAREAVLSGGLGAAAGVTVAMLPGATSGIGTVIAMQVHRLRTRLHKRRELRAARRLGRAAVDSRQREADDDDDMDDELAAILKMIEEGSILDAAPPTVESRTGEGMTDASPSIDEGLPQIGALHSVCPSPPDPATRSGVDEVQLEDTERTILILGSVNTAASLTVLAGLFILLRPRSGVAIAVNELLTVQLWQATLPPQALAYLLMGLIVATLVAYPATCGLARLCARWFPRLDYQRLLRCIVAGLTLLVLLFTGPLGLLVLAVSTAVGLVAPLAGVRRSHAMGVLLVPIMVSFAA